MVIGYKVKMFVPSTQVALTPLRHGRVKVLRVPALSVVYLAINDEGVWRKTYSEREACQFQTEEDARDGVKEAGYFGEDFALESVEGKEPVPEEKTPGDQRGMGMLFPYND